MLKKLEGEEEPSGIPISPTAGQEMGSLKSRVCRQQRLLSKGRSLTTHCQRVQKLLGNLLGVTVNPVRQWVHSFISISPYIE